MRRVCFFFMTALLTLAGCNNDKNLVKSPALQEQVEFRILIDEIDQLKVEKTAQGVILIAFARMPNAGYWNAELVALNDGKAQNGVLSYEFRVLPPLDGASEKSQSQFVAGLAISNNTLAGARKIEVRGAGNKRTLSL